MKVYTNTTFGGHWPVGTSAVVMAENEDEAMLMLEDELRSIGLPQRLQPSDMKEFTEGVRILQNGNY